MKKSLLQYSFLCLSLLCFPISTFAQQINNVFVEQVENQVNIYYDLISNSSVQNFEILLQYSINKGKTYLPITNGLSGDIGLDVPIGNRRKIEWNVHEEMPALEGHLLFKVTGNWTASDELLAQVEPNKKSEVLPSFGHQHHSDDFCRQAEFVTNQEAIEMVEKVLRQMGIPQRNFEVIECDEVQICKAKMVRNVPVILYNHLYIDRIKTFKELNFTSTEIEAEEASEKSETDWEFLTILLHEIGHIQLHHLTNYKLGEKSSKELELEADFFAGFHLFSLGATMQQAQRVMYSSFISEKGTLLHPARAKRLEAIANGWKESESLKSQND